MSDNADWMPLLVTDLDWVNKVADSVHTTLPEKPEVFEEKVRLCPSGCRKLVRDGEIVGYGISHPWMLDAIPPLDDFLVALPKNPQCIYIHDVVVLPTARGQNAAARYIAHVEGLAKDMCIRSLALVSVYGTDVLWARLGFHPAARSSLEGKLATYGSTAKYMVRDLI